MMTGDLESSLYAQINEKRKQVAELREQVVELRAQLAERDMELVIKEMRIESLTTSLDDMRNRWKSAEDDWMQLRTQVATLTERLSRCTCTDDYGDVAE